MQIYFHQKNELNFTLILNEAGVQPALSADPKNLPKTFQLGIIKPNESKFANDYFACNSYMQQNLCGNVNIPYYIDSFLTVQGGTTFYKKRELDLALWATFEVAQYGTIEITNINNFLYLPASRLYKGDVTKNCNLPLVSNGTFSRNTYCIEPGIYSIQYLAASKIEPVTNPGFINLGAYLNLRLTFTEAIHHTDAKYTDPKYPEDLGDVSVKMKDLQFYEKNYFGTADDTIIIDGITIFNRIQYKQFYLSRPTSLIIQDAPWNVNFPVSNFLFSGKVGDGIQGLRELDPKYGKSKFNQKYSTACVPLPAGWYSIVSAVNVNCRSTFNHLTYIFIDTIKCERKFSQPSTAHLANNGSPLVYDPVITVGFPSAIRYSLPLSCMACTPDTSSIKQPLVICNQAPGFIFGGVAYYVFSIKDESTVKIILNNNRNSTFKIFKADVRNDYQQFADTTLVISECAGSGLFCRMQPGIYTLVVYLDLDDRVAPEIWVDESKTASNDFAFNAYDLGHILPNNNAIETAIEKVYCTTGAYITDPDQNKFYKVNLPQYNASVPYPMLPNYYTESKFFNQNTGPTDKGIRRNLWYTFTVGGAGEVNLTFKPLQFDDNNSYNYTIYKAGVNGNIPFAQLKATGKVDSTIQQGLQFVPGLKPRTNREPIYYSFNKTGCDTARFYVVADVYPGNVNALNNQFKLSVNYSGTIVKSEADYCTNAKTFSLNTTGTASVKAVITCNSTGESFGEDGSNMGCLTDGSKPFKTTWFKFSYSSSDRVDLSFRLTENTSAHFSEVNYRVLYGNCNAMTAGPCVENALSWFTLDCMGAGDYYIQVVSPEDAFGDVIVEVIAKPTHYEFCKPIDLMAPVANFSYKGGCNGAAIQFINFSTAGSEIEYLWNFGNGDTSTQKLPTVSYVAGKDIDTFYVTLLVIHKLSKLADSITLPVIIFQNNIEVFIDEKNIEINCDEKVQLKAGSNYPFAIYEWFPKDNLDNPYSPTPVYKSQNKSDTLKLIVRAENCELEEKIFIHFKPSVKIKGDSLICFGNSIELSADEGYWLYNWYSIEENKIIYTDVNNKVFVNSPGKYVLLTRTFSNCIARDTFEIKPKSNLIADLGKDTTLCEGDILELKPHMPAAKYLWSTGGTTASILVNKAGKYWLEMSDSLCTSRDTINVNFRPLPISGLQKMYRQCGDEILTLSVPNYADKYLWSTNETSMQINIGKAGKYFVTLSINNCISTDSFEVWQSIPPTISLGKDTAFCDEVALWLDAGDGAKYLWLHDSNSNRKVFITNYGNYKVQVFNVDGCISEDSIIIADNCEPTIYVPNAFTPQNEEPNNIFKAVGDYINEFEMKIYNRWGELIFESQDINKGWDGTFKGKLCTDNVYIWKVHYSGRRTNKFINGTVTIIR